MERKKLRISERPFKLRPLRMPRGQQPRRPFAPIYDFVCVAVRVWYRLANGFVFDRSAIKDIKKPVLVISNHQSNIDFLMVAATMFPLRLNFIVTTWFFNSKTLANMLGLMGCIPKKQFVPDTAAIKSAMKVVARGDSIAIFPEGQVSYSGTNCNIDPSIAKLIKKLGVTTINLTIRGNYLTYPKWASAPRTRKGRIETCAEVLFTAEQLQSMSLEEVTQKTLQALSYNEYDWQRENKVPFKTHEHCAEGADEMLYRCPQCGREFTMKTEGSSLYCAACGYHVRFNRYGFFEPVSGKMVYDNMADWYRWQLDVLKKELDDGKAVPMVSRCTFATTLAGKHGYHPCGEGTVTLNEKGLFYTGTKDGEPFQWETIYEHQTALPFDCATAAIDIHGPDIINFGYQLEEPHELMKYVELYTMVRDRITEA